MVEECWVDVPAIRVDFLSEAHHCQFSKAANQEGATGALCRGTWLRKRVQIDGAIARSERVPRYPPVEGRQAGFVHFAALGFKGIQFGPEAKLCGTQLLRVAPDALLDVVAAKPERPIFRSAAQG